MDFEIEWLLVLPLFFALGWLAAQWDSKKRLQESKKLPKSYFKGLNHLLDHLKNELNNNQITLEPVVLESVKEKTAYTDKEKFEKMAESRPALRLFKDELGLEAEI